MRLLLYGVVASALALAAPATLIAFTPVLNSVQPAKDPYQAALQDQIAVSGSAELVGAYARRGHKAVWIEQGSPRPEAWRLISLLNASADEGLTSDRYATRELITLLQRLGPGGSPNAAAAAELKLSRAYAAYLTDRSRPAAAEPIVFVDPELAPSAQTLATRFSAPDPLDLPAHNRLYTDLKIALARHRSAPTPVGDLSVADVEAVLVANLDRARGLPPSFGPRHILVDVAAGELRMVQDGSPEDRMKVVVGRPTMPTPPMAGFVRYAAFDPYWYVPPDLARDQFAPQALTDPKVLDRSGFEVLSDWSPTATSLAADGIDWSSIASGQSVARLRQKPGPDNPMGRVKFMLPNNLGIYLHDTPDKAIFRRSIRTASAGCVRLEDADRLSRWLLGRPLGSPGGVERTVDLQTPTPVFIVYMTAMVKDGEPSFSPDVYQRDAPAIARLRELGRLA